MKEWLTKNWVIHSLIVIGMLTVWRVGADHFRSEAEKNGIRILKSVEQDSMIRIDGMHALSTLAPKDLEKAKKLFYLVQNQKIKHKESFLILYPYYYASSTLLLILSPISVVLIFLTGRIGFDNTSPYVRTVFYTLAALTSFYALSPLVYKHDTNISFNINRYIQYDNLQNEIYNYALTKPNVTTTTKDSLEFYEFHTSISNKLSTLNSINIEFDHKAIPQTDFFPTEQ